KLGQKIKEKAIDIAGKVLKNRSTKDVATVAPIAGPLENPKASTWETLVGVLRNAFIKAILPGFERERARLTKKGRRIRRPRRSGRRAPAAPGTTASAASTTRSSTPRRP